MGTLRHLLLLVALALPACQPPKETPEFNPKDAVRFIEFDAGARNCSATYVAPSVLLTASHCLKDTDTLITINGTTTAILHVEHDGADHALVKVAATSVRWTAIGAEPKQGDEVEVWGNPISLVDQYRKGYVTGRSRERIMIDGRFWMGDSGAAIFKGDRIVGVVSGVYGQGVFYLTFAYPMKFKAEQWSAVQ